MITIGVSCFDIHVLVHYTPMPAGFEAVIY